MHTCFYEVKLTKNEKVRIMSTEHRKGDSTFLASGK